jgi:hypothetical protein
MPRAARRLQWTEAACSHVRNRGHACEIIFPDDEERSHFLHLLARSRQRLELRRYPSGLLDNPLPLRFQRRHPDRLSKRMAGLWVAYGHPDRRCCGRVGHRFPERFKSPALARRRTCGGAVAPWSAILWRQVRCPCRGRIVGPIVRPRPRGSTMPCWRRTLGRRRCRRRPLGVYS